MTNKFNAFGQRIDDTGQVVGLENTPGFRLPAPEVACPCVICGKESVVQDEDGNDLCAPCNKEVSTEVKRLEAIIEAVDFVLARRAS